MDVRAKHDDHTLVEGKHARQRSKKEKKLFNIRRKVSQPQCPSSTNLLRLADQAKIE